MLRKFSPFLIPLVVLAGLIVSQAKPFWFLAILGIILVVMLIFFKVISRKSFKSEWNVWVNYSLFVISSFLQLAIIESSKLQLLYTVIIFLVWFWLVYSLIQYFSSYKNFSSKQYLEINRFIYFATLWQALNFIYFGFLFFNLSFWLGGIIAGVIVWLLARHIIHIDGLKKSSSFLVLSALTLTSVEIFVAMSLLPIHFYIQSALATLWFFFIIELTLQGQELKSRKKLFWRYGLLFIIVSIILILTSYTS